MKEFILIYWQVILFTLIFLVIIPLFFIITKQWLALRKYALKMIHIAEVSITGSKAGQERFQYVMDALYGVVIPTWLRPFIPKTFVAKKLQVWFDEIKKLLEHQPTIIKPPDEQLTDIVNVHPGTDASHDKEP
jgi:hypothetical protein